MIFRQLGRVSILCFCLSFLLSCGKDEEKESPLIVGTWHLKGQNSGTLTMTEEKRFDFQTTDTEMAGTGQFSIVGRSAEVSINPFDLQESSFATYDDILYLNYDSKGVRTFTIKELSKNKLVFVRYETNSAPSTYEFHK